MKDNFFVKNLFSIITLLITLGGFLVGYVKLQVTVSALEKGTINKEIVRAIAKEIAREQMIPLQKDVMYSQRDIARNTANIKVLFRKSGNQVSYLSRSLKKKNSK